MRLLQRLLLVGAVFAFACGGSSSEPGTDGGGAARVVLFGGGGNNVSESSWLGDTWTWDGTRWELVSSTAPSPRCGAGASTMKGQVVVFGGSARHGDTDTWTWNGATWTLASDDAAVLFTPSGVAEVSSTLNGNVVSFGGFFQTGTGGATVIWSWDGASWTHLDDPEVNLTPTAATTLGDHIVVFGAVDDFPSSAAATYTWDGTSFTQVSATGPGWRVGP